jgi:hypothetical protein
MRMRRPTLARAIALLFAILGVNAWVQVGFVVAGRSDDPTFLVWMQCLIGLAGVVTAWAAWTCARWGWIGALSHGILTAGMLAALPRLLALPAEARPGIFAGAATMMVLSGASAWYLYRATRRLTDRERSSRTERA